MRTTTGDLLAYMIPAQCVPWSKGNRNKKSGSIVTIILLAFLGCLSHCDPWDHPWDMSESLAVCQHAQCFPVCDPGYIPPVDEEKLECREDLWVFLGGQQCRQCILSCWLLLRPKEHFFPKVQLLHYRRHSECVVYRALNKLVLNEFLIEWKVKWVYPAHSTLQECENNKNMIPKLETEPRNMEVKAKLSVGRKLVMAAWKRKGMGLSLERGWEGNRCLLGGDHGE